MMLSFELWPSRNQRLHWCILTVCLGVCIRRASAQGAGAEVIDAAVGRSATIPAPVSVDVVSYAWYRGTAVASSQLICTYFVSSSKQVNGPQYTGPESGRPDGSLQIRDLRTNYTGNYTVTVITNGANPATATRQLRVYEPVTTPTVKYASSQLVENQGPAEITCDTPSVPVTILWSFNSNPTLPGNIIQSADNRTLTISNVSREDSGIYQCTALNPVSRSMSDPQTLTVTHGPENVKIIPPVSQLLQVGDKLSLSCTVESVPAPQYQWLLNNSDLNRPGNTYTIEKVSLRDNGNYTCVAYNTDTGLSAKASVSIAVYGNPCPAPCSCWQTTLGVACGVLLGAAIIVAGMAVHYERRLNQKGTDKDANVFQNPSVIKNPNTQYENMRKGREGQSAIQDSAADPAYMELKYGDQATYEQIKRP
ncbi:carcinoembryonic antigen-related cell adhesion molecule 6-like isoform X2 [Pleurodeles waltl]|uniref:carcinoembryonic antigen-related cell adhesion molecule 6-like isoform X2 n=1 Tax=Pleurodeles waltl TaxID=8319 RepID=UPI0037097021